MHILKDGHLTSATGTGAWQSPVPKLALQYKVMQSWQVCGVFLTDGILLLFVVQFVVSEVLLLLFRVHCNFQCAPLLNSLVMQFLWRTM